MSTGNLLPELPGGLAKTAHKRKRLSSKERNRYTKVPDEVVAGLRWLMDAGASIQMLRICYPGVPHSYLRAVRSGIIRAEVLPRCPPFISETFWQDRYRWK